MLLLVLTEPLEQDLIGQFSDHSWEKGKLTKNNKPAYGATAMIVWDGGGEHVAFVIGKSTNGNIAILGGNQSVKRNNVKVGRGITKNHCLSIQY